MNHQLRDKTVKQVEFVRLEYDIETIIKGRSLGVGR